MGLITARDFADGDFADGDRVIWSEGPAYRVFCGPGEILGFWMHEKVLLATVRFDDPGLDDEDVPLNELRRLMPGEPGFS